MNRVILWDFDGTLAHRPGMWRGCLVETLDEHAPGHGIDPEELRPFLRDGFPWDSPDAPHPELCEPDAWWAHVEVLLAAAYDGRRDRGRATPPSSPAMSERATSTRAASGSSSPTRRPVLERLREEGWRHVVLSNHVPELPAIAEGLGLTPLVDHIVTSAATGYEKPHPEAFRLALELCGNPDEVWMVGDNPHRRRRRRRGGRDPAVLVRTQREPAERVAADLYEAAATITGNPMLALLKSALRVRGSTPRAPGPHPHP